LFCLEPLAKVDFATPGDYGYEGRKGVYSIDTYLGGVEDWKKVNVTKEMFGVNMTEEVWKAGGGATGAARGAFIALMYMPMMMIMSSTHL